MNATGRDLARTPLRIRKRNRTRWALQRAAIDLVEQKGYQDTSVDEICDRAEVSRSTFFRYFGSKDAVFDSDLLREEVRGLLDAPGPLSLRALEDRVCAGYQQLSPEEWDTERRRKRLIQTIPELRAMLLSEIFRPFPLAVDFVTRMLDLPSDSLRARTIAGAIIGALAVQQLPTPGRDYQLPATTDDMVALVRTTFRELDIILNPDQLRS